MEQNKTTKYFKYAIGEIVLVVFGILIALQINNWNENHKNLKRENTILLNLKEDLTSDLMKLDSLKQGFENSVNSKKVFEDIFDEKIKPTYLVPHFKNQYTVILIDFVPNTITIDQIKNSEGSNIISSPELSRQLYSLYNNYEEYRTKLEIALDKNQQMIDYASHFYKDVLNPTEEEIIPLLDDKYFVNLIRANFTYGLESATNDIYEQCKRTLQKVNEELR